MRRLEESWYSLTTRCKREQSLMRQENALENDPSRLGRTRGDFLINWLISVGLRKTMVRLRARSCHCLQPRARVQELPLKLP